MAHAPVPDAVLGSIAIALAWGLAVWVLSLGPRRPMNRLLALLLYFEGAFQWINWNDAYWGEFGTRVAAFFIGPAFWGLPLVYLLLLAHLDTRATAFLRTRAGRGIVVGLLALSLVVFVPGAFVILAAGEPPAVLKPLEPVLEIGFVFTGFVSLFALAAAILASRRATDRIARARAKAYAVAFGVRDLLFAAGILLYLDVVAAPFGAEADRILDPWRASLPTLASIAFVPLLTAGLLRTGVIDVEARDRRFLDPAIASFLLLGGFALALLGMTLWIEPLVGALAVFAVAVLLFAALVVLQFRLNARTKHILVQGPPGAAREHLEVGALLSGRYRVLHELGRGAHGTAWLADDTALARTVVIKSLDARRHDPYPEAQRLAAVNHPHVVQVHDIIRAGDMVHLVLEHVPGGTLKARLAEGAVLVEEARRLGGMLLSAVEAVHEAGLVHRDVKPGNVFLTHDGAIRLGDFGIARPVGLDETVVFGTPRGTMGTIPYMSPEQAGGRKVGPASDLYSAGLVLFEVCAGEPYWFPRAGESGIELQRRIAKRRARSEGLTRLPSHLRPFFERALAPEPAERFPDATAMLHAWGAAWQDATPPAVGGGGAG